MSPRRPDRPPVAAGRRAEPTVALPNREKFAGERIERLLQGLREEDTYEAARSCPACDAERRRAGDDTSLCPTHLARVLGL